MDDDVFGDASSPSQLTDVHSPNDTPQWSDR